MSKIAMAVRRAGIRVRSAQKWQVLAACLVAALALLALVTLSQLVVDPATWREGERELLRPAHKYNTLPYMIATVAALSVWGPFSCWRCFDPRVRRYMMWCFNLFAAWMAMVILKYAVRWDVLTEALWYCFYVPLLFIPMLCLFAALRAAGVDDRPAVIRSKRVLFLLDVLLLLVVLTNGFHYAVFRFDRADPNWGGNYQYAPAYYAVYAMMVGQFLLFFGLLFTNARRQLRGTIFVVAFICALAVIYGLAYVFRVPFFFSGNFALSYTWFVCVALELCFDLGLIPSFAHYGRLFETLPIDVKVYSRPLDRAVDPMLYTEKASPVTAQGRACVQACTGGPVRLTSSATSDVVYRAQRGSGGVVLVTEDVSAISQRRLALEQRHRALRASCILLEQERLMRERLRKQESEKELYDEVDRSISEALGKARELLAQAEGLPEHEAISRLTLAKMLVSYCKRKGGIVLARRGDADFEREKLQLIVGELVSDLQTAGVDCGALVETGEILPIDVVSVLYDCLYDFAIASLYCADPVLMIYFSDYSDGAVEMRLTLSTGEQRSLIDSEEVPVLRAMLDARDVAYRLTGSDGMLVLVVVVRKGA